MDIDFALLRQNAGDSVPVLIAHIDPDDDRDRLVEYVRELCRCFVNIAAATLLLEGRPQPFFLNLCRASENWRRLLVHLERRGLPPPPASWGLIPLAGAMAAGHFSLAAELAGHLPAARRMEEEEYESEFAWASALGALALHAERGVDPAPQLARLASAAKERCWSALSRALVDADSPTFAAAFDDALASYEASTEARAQSFTVREDHFAAHRYLWFEGLALLRLARKRGLDIPNVRYRFCPPLAQVAMTERYQGDWVASIGDTLPVTGSY